MLGFLQIQAVFPSNHNHDMRILQFATAIASSARLVVASLADRDHIELCNSAGLNRGDRNIKEASE